MPVKFKTFFLLFTVFIFAASCKKKKPETETQQDASGGTSLAVVGTSLSIINCYGASFIGEVVSQETYPITQRGICVDTLSRPNISKYCVVNGAGTGTFIAQAGGMKAGKVYYARAYATDATGTRYGNEISFKTLEPWRQVNSSLTYDNIDTDGAKLYGFGYTNQGAYLTRSEDFGVSWTDITANVQLQNIGDFLSHQGTLFVCGYSGVWRSDDNGTSWAAAGAGLPANVMIRCMVSKGSDIFCGTSLEGVYKSSDKGNTWISLKNGLPTSCYIISMCVKDNVIFLGTDSGVYLSKDDGNNWLEANNGLSYAGYRGVVSMTSAGNSIFVGLGNYNGVYYTEDNGASWKSITETVGVITPNSLVSFKNVVYAATLGQDIRAYTANPNDSQLLNFGLGAGPCNYKMVIIGSTLVAINQYYSGNLYKVRLQ
jgi:photosystem II stability/assembly factor-like uncharacterized protein